jgi:ATP-binding cassette subfamily B protein
MKKILSYIGRYKKYVILTPLMLLSEVVMDVLLPFIMGLVVDRGISQGISHIIQLGLLMIFISFLSLIFGYLGGKFASKASTGFAKNLRQTLFDKIQKFSIGNINKYSTSSLVVRITADVDNIQRTFMAILRITFRAPIMLIGACIMVVATSPRLSLIFVSTVPILAIFFIITIIVNFPKFQILLKEVDLLNSNIQENLMGIRVVKSFVRENYEHKKFEKVANKIKKIQFSTERISKLTQPFMQLIISCCIISIIWFGSKLMLTHRINTGQMMTFVIYTYQILSSLAMISYILISVLFSKASIARIMEILDEEIDIKDISSGKEKISLDNGDIEYKNVNFSYNKDKNTLVLADINLKINSGETIGIIGGTASGKSSLVQLLPRLYDTLSGDVLVGRHNVRDYDLDTLQNGIAIVLQKNTLFSGTIRENLLWGNKNSSDKEIMEACEIAQASEFIQLLPDGLDTMLERGATNLSGGQKQRLCIARALLKRPKILILDDSTSAVDNSTDIKIRMAFREKLANITKIIISQRISSLKEADNIVVIDNGKINEIGNHEYLLANNDIYREIYYSQQDNFTN